MGLFDNFFKSTVEGENISKVRWIALTDKNKLDEIISLSEVKPVLIFKHSTRCGISRMALKTFEREFDLEENKMDLYFLDLLNYRALSQDISTKFNVAHQSPQVLVLKNGKVVYHDSHDYISFDKIKEIIK